MHVSTSHFPAVQLPDRHCLSELQAAPSGSCARHVHDGEEKSQYAPVEQSVPWTIEPHGLPIPGAGPQIPSMHAQPSPQEASGPHFSPRPA